MRSGDDQGPDGRSLLSRADHALNALDNPAVILVFLLPVLLQWVVPLVRSRFWLDETVTWWATDRGLRELITRCIFPPGSILYNSFILLLRSLGVHREWMLRLPSMLGVIMAAVVLFDLARRWFSKRVAIAALVFFCAQPWVSFAAADARPYGLGLLMVVTATWLMLRWLETGRLGYAGAYGLAAALIVHFHMLFATVLVFHGIFLIVAMPRNGIFLIVAMPRNRQILRQAVLAVCVLAALTLPLVPQYLHAFSDRAAHTFPNPRTLWDLCRQFLPTVPMIASALVAAVFVKWRPGERATVPRRSVLLAGLWAVVPLVLLFLAAKLTGSDLFVGRYALPYVPGIALCFGMILEYLSPRLRTGLVLLVFLLPVAIRCAQGEFASHTTQGNWAAAIEFIDHENRMASLPGAASPGAWLPAMMRSPFPESDFIEWTNARMNDSAIYAPLAYYSGSAEWHPLPVTFTAKAAQAIDNLMQAQTAAMHGLYFAEYGDGRAADGYRIYFESRGEFREVGNFEGVRVFRLRW